MEKPYLNYGALTLVQPYPFFNPKPYSILAYTRLGWSVSEANGDAGQARERSDRCNAVFFFFERSAAERGSCPRKPHGSASRL